jgi:hypothetical protein
VDSISIRSEEIKKPNRIKSQFHQALGGIFTTDAKLRKARQGLFHPFTDGQFVSLNIDFYE